MPSDRAQSSKTTASDTGRPRVGVLTHHWVANFGANLQALATQLEFTRQGAAVEFLDYKEPGWEARVRGTAGPEQMAKHDEFVSRYLNVSPPLADRQALADYAEACCDVVVVGSDAMFEVESPYDPLLIARSLRRRKPLPRAYLPAFWLTWPRTGTSPRRASLSVSAMGTNFPFIRGRLRREMALALERFDFLGVRDDWTLRMVSAISGRSDARHYPDPVFSLLSNLQPTAGRPVADVSNCVLVSGELPEETLASLREVLALQGLGMVGVRIPERTYEYRATQFNLNEALGPLEWFDLLGHAAGYIGIRFHALVGCMVHGTPVVNVDPHARSRVMPESSKMYDLCRRAGTPERFFTTARLGRTPASRVTELLHDAGSVERANDYSAGAGDAFASEVAAILGLLA